MTDGIGPFGPPQDPPPVFGPPPPPQITPPILGDPNQFAGEFVGPPAAPTADVGGLRGLETAGNVLAVAGLVTSAIGSFYAAESKKTQLKSQALDLKFQQSIANLNARAAEQDAVALFRAGRNRRALSGLRFGQVRAATRVSAAARGVQAGVGSAREIAESVDFAAGVDALSIDINTLRQVSAARRRAVDFRNQALLAGVSARNVRGSERSISPGLQAFTTLLGGAGPIASGIAQRGRTPLASSGLRAAGVTTRGGVR